MGTAKLHWRFAHDVSPSVAQALTETMKREALLPVEGIQRRGLATRAHWLIPLRERIGCDVFAKEYGSPSVSRRLRGLFWHSPADREFDNLIRLGELGIPTPRPVAKVDEGRGLARRSSFVLMEYIRDARPAAEEFRRIESADPRKAQDRDENFAQFTEALAKFLLDIFAKGVVHRDLRTANILVQTDDSYAGYRCRLLDARAVDFRRQVSGRDVEDSLSFFTGFLLKGGSSPAGVRRFLETICRLDRNGGGYISSRPEDLLAAAECKADTLRLRDERKSRERALNRPSENSGTKMFERKYGSTKAAEGYRDRRFSRSRHGRRVDAAEQVLVERLVGELGVRENVLELPCGAGRFFRIFFKRNLKVTGADISPSMLSVARQEAEARGKRCRLVTADARALPFADGEFELVFVMRLLHRIKSVEERLAILGELARVSNRWVLLSFYDSRSLRGIRDRLRGGYPGQTKASIRSEAEQAGLRVVQFVPVWFLARQTLVVCAKGS